MIYFAHAVGTDFVKIGFTAGDPVKRLAELQTGCPHKLELIASLEGQEQDEGRWHQDFAGDRVQGEWFRLTPPLMAAVCKAVSGLVTESPPVRRTANGGQKIWVLVIDGDGLLQLAGKLVSETADSLRLEIFDGTMLVSAGRLTLSGELRDAPRAQCRLFIDRLLFNDEVADVLDHSREMWDRRRKEAATIVAPTPDPTEKPRV